MITPNFLFRKIFAVDSILKLSFIGLITSLAFAMFDTVWALYIDSFVGSAVIVGFIAAFLTLVSFVSNFLLIPLVEKSDKAKLYSFSLFVIFVSFIIFVFVKSVVVFILLSTLFTVFNALRITSYGLIVKDNSEKRKLSRNEGVVYTFLNISWVVGPLVAGFLLFYGFYFVFLASAFVMFLAMVGFHLTAMSDLNNIRSRTDNNFFKNFKQFFRSKDRVLAYILRGGQQFWWSFIYIFMPLYIIDQGIGVRWVGYFLFAIAVPLILTEYYFAKSAGEHGFRKIFVSGFGLISLCAFASFFVGNIFIVMAILVFASFGVAMLEPVTEAYFFDILRGKQDSHFYGPFNTSLYVSGLLARLMAAVILIFLPFEYLFVFFGLVMLGFGLMSLKTKKVIESRRG